MQVKLRTEVDHKHTYTLRMHHKCEVDRNRKKRTVIPFFTTSIPNEYMLLPEKLHSAATS